jgi:catechol 2,3-dioxygenase-like lactoylglutathione lyase family enzyme
MIQRLDHIDLRVPSVPDAETFFAKLGFTTLRRHGGGRGSIEMALPGTNQVFFEIREDLSVTATTIDHVALALSNPEATVEALQSTGVEFTRTHHRTPTGRTVSNFTDPFGGKWQLAEDTE